MRTWLISLGSDECLRRLGESSLGRLAVIIDGHPEIFPVVYAFDADSASILFPTVEGTKLHGALTWPSVAFEIDALDADGESGWSVVVRGRAELVTDADERARLQSIRTVAWRTEPGVQWVRITAEVVTGRRILAAPE
jgi:nitroimidazol reductase NimA-like FMN-containing flavoprotein (pyridoxamine 5'-phosphate oxidase superfamily)